MATRPGDGWADRVRQDYAFAEPAVDLGNLVVDGVADTGACVRIPLTALPRHGLVTGADGTGKTSTLRLMAEGLSAAGVPAVLVELDGEAGHPAQLYALGEAGAASSVRAPLREFGPGLLGMVLGLDEMQADALHQVFDFAAEQERPLVDLADLRAVLEDLAVDSEALERVGGTSAATVGAVARALGGLAEHGAGAFFGEPPIDAGELLRTGDDDAGVVSVLALPDVTGRPVLSSALLLWLLAELAAKVPEGTDGPTIAFLVDDAQLLFDGASKELVTSVRQTLRSIRVTRIGVFLAARDPLDLHPHILRQLRNRIQHACTGAGDAVDALDGAAPASVPSPYDLSD
ncbi:MAG: helicase HerA-like domain-containing protein, partial [Nocardioidaceae bacterium]